MPQADRARIQAGPWRLAGLLLLVTIVLSVSPAAGPARPAEAAPPLAIRIGLAWDRWAAECAGQPSSGIGSAAPAWRWPAAEKGVAAVSPEGVSPARGSYLVGTAGPAVALAATDSAWLARSAQAAAARAAVRGNTAGIAWGVGTVLRRAGPTWYCLLDPAAGDAATVAAAAAGMTQAGWPAFTLDWPRSPGAPGPSGSGVAIALDGGHAGMPFPTSFPALFSAAQDGSPVRHAGQPYRGALQVVRAGERGLFSVINRLDIEDYLLGVVPSEMPAAWPIEALKAQAVAARTYAVANLGKHASRGFDLCDDIHCQAYLGYNNEYASPTAAVRATAGVVATYGGRLINAVYHAHAGGATDSSAVIWGSAEPYLAGTDRTYEKPYYWTASDSRGEVERVVATAFPDGVPEGLFPLLRMTPTHFTAGHRALRVDLHGAGASAQMTSSKLRAGLGTYRLRDANFGAWAVWVAVLWPDAGAAAALEAAQQVVTWAPGARGEGVVVTYVDGDGGKAPIPGTLSWLDPAFFVFSGQGFGHGVGMSQWGAREMAAVGKSYREILTNFYRGITLAGNYGR